MSDSFSIVKSLQQHVKRRPQALAFAFSTNGDVDDEQMTYGELDAAARRIAAKLVAIGRPGDRVVLLYPSGLEYVAALFGTFFAGMVAVPAVPPTGSSLDASVARVDSLLRATTARAVLCTQAVERLARSRTTPGPTWLVTRELDATSPSLDAQVTSRPDDLALLQYTSGSTTTPRGVMLSQRNLEANLEMIHRAFDIDASTRVVSWLPLHHDMGLIGCVLGPATWGVPCVLMPPLRALARPANWLQTMSRHRATTTASPNFGYELALRNITDAQRDALDLSSWRVALNAAEPVREQTMRDFTRRFESCGFRGDAFRPTYGLAEATVFVSSRRGIAAHAYGARPACVVSVGVPAVGSDIQIVDATTMVPMAEGELGEIWVRGPHVAGGYWQQPDSSAMFRAHTVRGEGPYLRTGDLGFIVGGELFVHGRIKDLIIIQGRNYSAEDIEDTASRVGVGTRRRALAAFSVEASRTTAAAEHAVIVIELERGSTQGGAELDALAAAIRVAVSEAHALAIQHVVFVRPGSIPRTTSGKTRRNACREAWLAKTLDVVAESTLPAARGKAEDAAPGKELRTRLLAMSADDRRASLEAHLLRELADLLGMRVGDLDALQTLPALGVDSLKAVELRFRVEDELGIVFEIESIAVNLTIAALADVILEQLTGEQSRVDAVPLQAPKPSPSPSSHGSQRGLNLSLLFFSGDDGAEPEDRYRLVLEAARFADQRGFSAVWMPERHFHAFGGLFPNPSIVGAALAVVTSRIRIRAGSVVIPLHHPLRVAEEWSVVDNLSKGRVDVAFAAGRNARDFVLAPDAYGDRASTMFASMRTFRQLWRGESIALHDGLGRSVDVHIHPPPVQTEPGLWITTSENPETFVTAGEVGAHVLTGLVQQTPEELAEKIKLYRSARANAGHAGEGEVTLMLHAYVGESDDAVRELVREPMTSYLRSFLSLWAGQDEQRRFATLAPEAQEQMLRLGFERFFQSRALFGGLDRVEEIATMYADIGVTEIACLVDFGLARENVLAGLEQLAALRERIESRRRVST